jgi:hypothetical protein
MLVLRREERLDINGTATECIVYLVNMIARHNTEFLLARAKTGAKLPFFFI